MTHKSDEIGFTRSIFWHWSVGTYSSNDNELNNSFKQVEENDEILENLGNLVLRSSSASVFLQDRKCL